MCDKSDTCGDCTDCRETDEWTCWCPTCSSARRADPVSTLRLPIAKEKP